MSTACSAGVWKCGPKDALMRFLMAALADNADDFGFCFPSQETLADKICCDKRTVMRRLEQLETEGWIRIARKVVNKKGNVYFLVLEKIGVTVSPDARISALHAQLLKRSGDNVSPMDRLKFGRRPSPQPSPFLPEKSGDTETFSGDNPQPPQVTPVQSQVTNTPESGDTACHPNRNQPSREPSEEPSGELNSTPLPPTARGVQADGAMLERFNRVKLELKSDLAMPMPGMREIVPGQNDYDTCFRDWWLDEVRYEDGDMRLMTSAVQTGFFYTGFEKYRSRVERTLRKVFSPNGRYRVTVNVQPEAHDRTINPAA